MNMFKMYVKFAESLKHLVVIVRIESGKSYSDKIAEELKLSLSSSSKVWSAKVAEDIFLVVKSSVKTAGEFFYPWSSQADKEG